MNKKLVALLVAVAFFLGAAYPSPIFQNITALGLISAVSVVGTNNTQSGTTYTLASTDCGQLIVFTSAAVVTVTIPATLPIGCNIPILQAGTGQVIMTGSAVTKATLHNADSFTATAVQWAVIGISIEANSGGSSAIAVLTGRGA